MLKEFLAKKSTATPSTAGASYYALYVETILKQLSGSLRREAEHRIQQVLHDVEHKAEQQRSQQGATQQQCQPQSQARISDLIFLHLEFKDFVTLQNLTKMHFLNLS